MPDTARARHLLGDVVEGPDGNPIGRVAELIVDPATGRVQQVIVAAGGALGLGDKNVALRWDQLRIEYDMSRPGASQPPALEGATGAPASGTREGRAGQTPTAPSDATAGTAPGALTTPARRAGVRSADLRLVTDMTKDQLEAAPPYSFDDAQAGAAAGAPAPAAPAGSRTQ